MTTELFTSLIMKKPIIIFYSVVCIHWAIFYNWRYINPLLTLLTYFPLALPNNYFAAVCSEKGVVFSVEVLARIYGAAFNECPVEHAVNATQTVIHRQRVTNSVMCSICRWCDTLCKIRGTTFNTFE